MVDYTCGDCFQYYNEKWLDVRLEHSDGWILVWDNQMLPIVYGTKVKKQHLTPPTADRGYKCSADPVDSQSLNPPVRQ